ncbi:DUF3810 family protein [Ruminococcus albus]|uniref:DUF3810 domain-containing protein n=1 Tax=Ruminococcus albus TaxID=1264 RepID=A0A1H7P193_RUMAL|nr:DUF3810 family protein [Ruminococcus albus]SEL28837.1 Protein of unknown function [Ruminococcus albus]
MKKLSAYWRVLIVLLICSAVMGFAWFFPELCDKYTDSIFYNICNGVSRVTGLVPFAIGEIIMYIGAAAMVFAVIFLLLLIFLRQKGRYRRFCAVYFKTLLMALVCTVFIYMPTWYIPFCGTVLGKGETDARTEFTPDEVEKLVRYSVDGINSAAEEIEIASDGTVLFPTAKETQSLIADAMRSMGDEFPRLNGYYPPVKTALCSDILERMDITGYNYPFTMEPTHSKYQAPLDSIVTDAHELAHHKGYFLENEAEMLSIVALTQSPDPYLRIAGYHALYWWVCDSYYENIDTDMEKEFKNMIESGELDIDLPIDSTEESERAYEAMQLLYDKYYKNEPLISDRALRIFDASNGIGEEIFEEDEHIIDEMPAVDSAITATADKGWEIQEDILEENCYDGATLLLLQYYDGKLY